MGHDPLSPTVPARVKVLLLPIGQVRQSRFGGFLERLRQQDVVRLGDVSPDSRPHRTMFSPLAFPQGLIVYDLSRSLPPESHLPLSPFEIWREALIVVGIVDAKSLDQNVYDGAATQNTGDEAPGRDHNTWLSDSLEGLKSDYPRALVHQILVFDHLEANKAVPDGVTVIPVPEKSRITTIKTVMCDLTSKLLAEMTVYAKSLQGTPSLDTPKIENETSSGTASALPPHMARQSGPSSAVGNSRSFSPPDDARAGHRMSLPVNLLSGIGSRAPTPHSRSASPATGTRTPPITFDEMKEGPEVASPSKKLSQDMKRPESQDRGLITGLGPSSLGERERIKGKARIGVVIGAMYLLAGRWPDAVKELVQSATVARSNSDYVWQAKALDYLLIVLLMYAWAGMDFRIPDILYPGGERPGSAASRSGDSAERLVSLEVLKDLLPDLVNNILNLYARAWTFTSDKIHPLIFSYTTIRFSKLLAILSISDGHLNDSVLRHIVLNRSLSHSVGNATNATPFISSSELVTLLFRAYPTTSSEFSPSTADRTMILAGIASVLSDMGYHRKKALILKDLMSTILPALVQARKEGAAEMGVHPAASLAALNTVVGSVPTNNSGGDHDRVDPGMQDFLSLVCEAYGIKFYDQAEIVVPNPENSKGPSTVSPANILENTISRIIQQASTNANGAQDLKVDILRSCINICEALPDLEGALRYSAALLRTAGSGIAPGPDDIDGSPALPIEEQVRLSNNISRTLIAARKIGLEHPEAEYWDEFLIRGVEILEPSPSKSLIPHAKSDLEVVETIDASIKKNPFIYNPSQKTSTSPAAETLLVAQEEAYFRVTLQNLYDFDVVIEQIRLDSDGAPFDGTPQSTMIGPYRTQTLILGGIPRQSGVLNIRGCKAKIRGCRERTFPSFSEPWALKADVKGRNLSLSVAEETKARPLSTDSSETAKRKPPPPPQGPKPVSITLKVLSVQPSVTLKSISIPQSAIMLLEGETRIFTITLQNVSRTTPVDLLLLSFTDSTAAQLQTALENKELSAAELYELELASSHQQSFRWLRREEDGDINVAPGAKKTLEIEVRGNRGLSHGTIQVDYGYLGTSKREVKESFHTRQLTVPLTVTVNASVELIRNDIVPLSGELTWQDPETQQSNFDSRMAEENSAAVSTSVPTAPESLLNRLNLTATITSESPNLLLLDFRNSWPHTLTLTLSVHPPPSSSSHTTTDLHPSPQTITTNHPLPPGSTHRIPLPLPPLHLPASNSHASIPSLSQKRQFVVSTTRTDPAAERTIREEFWYREEVLKRVTARWKEEKPDGKEREGAVALRGLRLTPRMVQCVRAPEVRIEMEVALSPCENENLGRRVKRVGRNRFSVPTETFLVLKVMVWNRGEVGFRGLVRLQPSLRGQDRNVALDLGKKLAWSGVLQRVLGVLEVGGRREVEVGFCVLAGGEYEWGGCVEEVVSSLKKDEREGVQGRRRAQTGEVDLEGTEGRRVWWVGEPCVVVAGDWEGGEGEGDADQKD